MVSKMKALVAVASLFAIGCTNAPASVRALEASGFTDVQTGGYSWLGCGHGDWYATEFTAKNPQGRRVGGVVCCGLFKNCIVRF